VSELLTHDLIFLGRYDAALRLAKFLKLPIETSDSKWDVARKIVEHVYGIELLHLVLRGELQCEVCGTEILEPGIHWTNDAEDHASPPVGFRRCVKESER
jgi:hypothetical protein